MALDLKKLSNAEKKQLLINRISVATKVTPEQVLQLLRATKEVLSESSDIIADLLGVQTGMVSLLMKKLTGGKNKDER